MIYQLYYCEIETEIATLTTPLAALNAWCQIRNLRFTSCAIHAYDGIEDAGIVTVPLSSCSYEYINSGLAGVEEVRSHRPPSNERIATYPTTAMALRCQSAREDHDTQSAGL